LFGGGLQYAKLLGGRGLPIIDVCASAHDLTGTGLAPSTGSGGGLGAARASATTELLWREVKGRGYAIEFR
jgi:hypothetical protein